MPMMSPNQEGRGAYQPLTTADRVDAGDTNLEHRLYASETSPTFSQASTLRRTPASIPWTTYAIALVELAERASFYGLISIAPNFIQRPLPEGGPGTGAPPRGSETTPGALGLGLQTATAMFTLFTMLGYTSPLIGGALADMRWGKYKTIMIGVVVTIIAHVVSVYAALPSLLQSGKASMPFVTAMVLLCSCSGLIKANVAPVMAEQYTPIGDFTRIMPDGETVIVDREMTIQRIMSAYFASVNVGAFFAIASAFAEKYVGFWLAFLIPGIICLIMPFVLIIARPSLVPSPPPSSSALVDAIRGIKSSGDGLPELIDIEDEGEAGMRIKAEVKGKGSSMIWFFLFFAVYNVADGGINSLITSLAGSMTTQGVPNDFIITANPLAIVLSIPILNRFVYPFIEARGITFGPVKRVVTGFLIAAAAMTWCGVLQYRVYATSPCGWSATNCTEGSGVSPLSAWLVLPTPIMLGISEAIAVVSAMELGYIMSPPGLRSIVNALFLFTQSIAAVLVLFLIPLMRDPLLLLVFGIVTMSVLAAAAGVWRMYGHIDHAM